MQDKYDPKEIETRIYKIWEEKGYFKADNKSPKPSFCIVIPPPNVTGSLHMGHALNNTLQDILARYKRARGYNVLWLPGCDHAGIATQNVVERELKKEGLNKKQLGREKFMERVWQWKDKYGKTIMMQLRKLGSSLDWTRERFTMDEGLSDAVKEVFIRLYNEGLIYRGDYIVNWCPRCLTALSDIEVVHKEIDGFFYYIKYPYADDSGKYIEVATTRPETLLGDTAVAVHPEDDRYKDLKEGTLFVLPETGRKIPLIKDKYVDKTFGTGAVKITPAHDPNDFEIGLRHKLEIINVMTEDGKMNEKAGEKGKYKGLDRFKARQQIVEELKKQGLLARIDSHKHAVGHCYRCDTIVEPYVSTQWFVKTKPLARPAIDVVEKGGIKFVPDMWKKIYFEWMDNIKDWCISRQLWWGHRIPAYYCSCGETIVSKNAPQKCPKCGGTDIRQDEDVLDTWFSSALWPFSTLGWPEETDDLKAFFPTSVLVTSWDILFFWVARMIMMSMKFMGKQPFYHVVINSLVCDEHGKKMSKSKGNVIDPLGVMDKYSADALRFTMASLETQTRHISFSEDRLKGYHNFMNKIWNASKFVINNAKDYKEEEALPQSLKIFEKWILNETDDLKEKITTDMENYMFSDAALSIYDFFWHVFCDWYIEISKIELMKENSDYKNTVKNVLLSVLKDSLILMHVIIPFITEEIYQNLPVSSKKDSIMLETWPEKYGIVLNENEKKEMEYLKEIIYYIRNLRADFEIPFSEEIDVYITLHDGSDILKNNDEIIRKLAKVRKIHGEKIQKCVKKDIVSHGLKIGETGIDVKAIKDINKVLNDKNQEIDKLKKAIETTQNKLSDPDFEKNAPEKLKQEMNGKIDASRKKIEILENDVKNLIQAVK